MAGKKSAPHFFNFLLSSLAMLTLCNVVLVLMLPATAPAAEAGTIPSHSLAGGGTIPMLAMGGNDFQGWFKAAGKGAMIQTFHGALALVVRCIVRCACMLFIDAASAANVAGRIQPKSRASTIGVTAISFVLSVFIIWIYFTIFLFLSNRVRQCGPSCTPTESCRKGKRLRVYRHPLRLLRYRCAGHSADERDAGNAVRKITDDSSTLVCFSRTLHA